MGVNSSTIADVVLVSVILPNDLTIEDLYVIVSDIGTDEMLIGMDIIALGDFCISNGNGKTLFSFVSPPFSDKIDLLKAAEEINAQN